MTVISIFNLTTNTISWSAVSPLTLPHNTDYQLYRTTKSLTSLKSKHLQMTKCDSNTEICFGKGRKHCENGFFLRVFKSRDCVIKELTTLGRKGLKKIVGKGENDINCIVSVSHNVFYSIKENLHQFEQHWNCLQMLSV